jgi:hypothetical protein
MSTTPVLATPEFLKPFIIECDASGFGIRVVLMQDGHLIEFESRKLKKKNAYSPHTIRKCLQSCMN